MAKKNIKPDINFTIEADNIDEVIQASREAIERALEAVGQQAVSHIKQITPVDTGELRNSITHQTNKAEQAVYIGTNVEYAPYVEYGTVRQKAQPYLRPGIEDHLTEYNAIFQKELEKG